MSFLDKIKSKEPNDRGESFFSQQKNINIPAIQLFVDLIKVEAHSQKLLALLNCVHFCVLF